jgi:hypothetical protein
MMAQGCRKIRRQLSAYQDGELPVGEHIAVQTHLRTCPACAAELRELDELGACLRAGALATEEQPQELEGLPSAVISRLKAEDAESISGRTGRLFEDLHFVWAALGATGATVTCVAVIYLISLFAILPPAGYNKNPVVPNAAMILPSASLNTPFPAEPLLDEGDLALLLDAVVNRDGRVTRVELIQPDGTLKGPTKEERQAVEALLDLMAKTRFQPARFAGSPVPVAVNMVWLYASLTVKGKMPELQIQNQKRPGRAGVSMLRSSAAAFARLI